MSNNNPANPIPRLPSRPGRILLGGAAIIGGIFAGTWFYMSTKQARKASREPGERGALPSWEYRIKQAVETPRGAMTRQNTRPTGAVEPRAPPVDAPKRDPDRSQHGTLTTGEEALRAENGANM